MKFGYARVSRTDQNLELQTDALNKAGAEKIFVDKVSGIKAERPGLNKLLESMRSGDTVIIWKLDRLARSLEHLDELRKQF
ncbi:MAG TPA: recombinase family protein, partial [Pyrinomonadaceae bacterium]